MIDNSYDIPAMKFYVEFNDEGKKKTIPFENLDGLSMQDVRDVCKTSYLGLLVGASYKDRDGYEQIQPLYRYKFTCDSNDIRIDILFEEILRENMGQKKVERAYACFCQRYQGKTYNEIKQMIKK